MKLFLLFFLSIDFFIHLLNFFRYLWICLFLYFLHFPMLDEFFHLIFDPLLYFSLLIFFFFNKWFVDLFVLLLSDFVHSPVPSFLFPPLLANKFFNLCFLLQISFSEHDFVVVKIFISFLQFRDVYIELGDFLLDFFYSLSLFVGFKGSLFFLFFLASGRNFYYKLIWD